MMDAVTTQLDAAWAVARRVLAVRLDKLGDLLMTTPALGALRETFPRIWRCSRRAPA